MRVSFGVAVFFFSATIASGQAVGRESLSRCLAINSDLQRLACYDSTARGLRSEAAPDSLAAGNIGADRVGGWLVSRETNPLDDSPTVSLMLLAENGESKYNKPIGLLARCKSKETDVFVAWGEYLGSEAYITFRLGSGVSERQRWMLSSDKTATFVPGDARKFLRAMALHDRMVVQVTPYSESPRTATFKLSGLSEALVPLKAACGWN